MRVIHVAGWSGSGKTTFIRDLIPALSRLGRTGTVKHIGDHTCDLPAGKDTTVQYDAGSFVAAGIDQEKMMITCRSVSLGEALDLLADAGVRYAVIEGFKAVPFTKVVIGDLDIPALLTNPSVPELIAILDRFDSYHTLQSLVHELGGSSRDPVYTLSGEVDPGLLLPGRESLLEEEIRRLEGISAVRVAWNAPSPGIAGRYFVVCRSSIPQAGLCALSLCGGFFAEPTDSDLNGVSLF